jgi:hypothetical protein
MATQSTVDAICQGRKLKQSEGRVKDPNRYMSLAWVGRYEGWLYSTS